MDRVLGAQPVRAFRAMAIFALLSVSGYAGVFQNQVGWPVGSHKTVVLTGANIVANGSSWTLTAGRSVIASGKVDSTKTWMPMDTNLSQVVVLPDTLSAGTYDLTVASTKIGQVTVSSDAWEPVSKALLKGFYYQRDGIELTSKYAGAWARPISHPTGLAYYDEATTGHAPGTKFCPKGWFDAGDFNKYVVNSGISTWSLLSVAEQFKSFTDTLKWSIPEDGSGVPSILAEARWNLDWMLAMQDDDGGVFHLWAQRYFNAFEMPDKDTTSRWLAGKTTAASLNFAAVMALASRVYTMDPAFQKTTLAAAKKAWAWALANPAAYYKPVDFGVGQYGDANVSDEKYWASVELLISTGDSIYKPAMHLNRPVPTWSQVGALGLFEVVSHPKAFPRDTVVKALGCITRLADKYAVRARTGGWAALQRDVGEFPWGSNAFLANTGLVEIFAWLGSGNADYLHAADCALDHLMGRNPLGVSNVTGIGTKSPRNIHHRISAADGVADPIPGLLVGGPYMGGDDVGQTASEPWKCIDYRDSMRIALDWFDDGCSYATNEIAINWNAAGAYLATALSAIHKPSYVRPTWISSVGVREPKRTHERLSSGRFAFDEAGRVEARDIRGATRWTIRVRKGEITELPRESGTRLVTFIGESGARATWKEFQP